MQQNNNRVKKIYDSVLDAAANDVGEIAVDVTHKVVHYIRDWVINQYFTPKEDAKKKLEELEEQLRISDKNVSIGMRKKEIAVMWAMRKLGYSEEQTQEILNLANEAYGKN